MAWVQRIKNIFSTQTAKSLVLFSSLLILSYQTFVWREFAVDASVVQLKRAIGFGVDSYHVELGTICNTLKKFDCSSHHFGALVKMNPRNRPALANLAIAKAHTKSWEESKTLFESYFASGGNASDALYWYAQTIEALEGVENAIWWYYESLATRTSRPIALDRLVTNLIHQRRFIEAASAIASVHQGQMAEGSPSMELFDQAMNLWDGRQEVSVSEHFLPTFFENQVYAPVRLSENSVWRVGILNFDFDRVIINEDLVYEAVLRQPAQASVQRVSIQTPVGRIEATPIVIPEIHVLGKTVKNVKAFTCTHCPSYIGRSVMNQFEWSTFQKGTLRYVRVTF